MSVVEFLVENGATVDQVDNDGRSPLWIASQVCFFLSLIFKTFIYIEYQYGHLEIVEFLFKKGANIDQENKDNQTPLFIATSVCIFLSFFPFLRQSKSDHGDRKMIIKKFPSSCWRKVPILIKKFNVSLLFD